MTFQTNYTACEWYLFQEEFPVKKKKDFWWYTWFGDEVVRFAPATGWPNRCTTSMQPTMTSLLTLDSRPHYELRSTNAISRCSKLISVWLFGQTTTKTTPTFEKSGVNGIRTHDFSDYGAMLWQLSQLGACNFVSPWNTRRWWIQVIDHVSISFHAVQIYIYISYIHLYSSPTTGILRYHKVTSSQMAW